MKKCFILALSLVPTTFAYSAENIKKESIKDTVTVEKEDDKVTKYLTNYKGIVTGAIAVALGINTILRSKQAFEAVKSKDLATNRLFYGYFCNALLNGFVAWHAFVCSQKSWRQIK